MGSCRGWHKNRILLTSFGWWHWGSERVYNVLGSHSRRVLHCAGLSAWVSGSSCSSPMMSSLRGRGTSFILSAWHSEVPSQILTMYLLNEWSEPHGSGMTSPFLQLPGLPELLCHFCLELVFPRGLSSRPRLLDCTTGPHRSNHSQLEHLPGFWEENLSQRVRLFLLGPQGKHRQALPGTAPFLPRFPGSCDSGSWCRKILFLRQSA